jgi:hypothetical protein
MSNKLDKDLFIEIMTQLATHYGSTIMESGQDFILTIYWEDLKQLSDRQFQAAVATCVKKHPKQYGFFPNTDLLLEYGVGCLPEENKSAYVEHKLPALPSEQDRATPEQIRENRKRGLLIAQIATNSVGLMSLEQKEELFKNLHLKETHELEAIASNVKKASSIKNTRHSKWTGINEVAFEFQNQLEERQRFKGRDIDF